MALRRFVIERDIPKVGTFEREQLRGAAAKSNEVLHQLGPDIQWVESYVADNKTFCVYLAKDEAIIRKHAEISGFPATKITEVKKMIDPTTAAACGRGGRALRSGALQVGKIACRVGASARGGARFCPRSQIERSDRVGKVAHA